MKALITGIPGFVGRHLTNLLLKKGYQVGGTVRGETINLSEVDKKVKLFRGDLLDESFVKDALYTFEPDLIFHLASFTVPGASFAQPKETILNNVGVTINLLESAKALKARILLVSSAHVYGLVKEEENPVKENNPLRPESPYAVSKIAQDFLGLQYYLAYKMHIIRVRPSNQIGPGQRADFAVASFAKQIAEAEAGLREPMIKVGNLEAVRDFTDVRDMVQAYCIAILQSPAGEVYNLGSGEGLKVRDILDKLIRFSNVKIRICHDPTRIRTVDVPKLVIDYSKFNNLTGWHPEIPIEKSLEDVLDWWRKRVLSNE